MNRKQNIDFLKGVLSGKNIPSLTETDLSKAKVYLTSEGSDVVTVLLPEGGTEEITIQDLNKIQENNKEQWITFK